MRTTLFAAALIAPSVFAGIAPAVAQTAMVQVDQPWARATAGHGTTGAVYLTLTSHGPADALTGVSTPVAGMAMLHESRMENGVAKMVMQDSVALPAHTTVTFKPGALHIMLMDLKQPLKAGSAFPVTLTFAHAAPQTVTVTVMAPGASGPAAARSDGGKTDGGKADGGKTDDMGGMKMD